MSYIEVLQAEIEPNDPLGRGYAGMTAVQVAADLNTKYRTRIRTSMSGDEVRQATVAAEFAALSAAKQQMWVSFCSDDTLDPQASGNVAFVNFIFGAGSTTLSNLATLRQESVSRAEELTLGVVTPGQVEEARRA